MDFNRQLRESIEDQIARNDRLISQVEWFLGHEFLGDLPPELEDEIDTVVSKTVKVNGKDVLFTRVDLESDD